MARLEIIGRLHTEGGKIRYNRLTKWYKWQLIKGGQNGWIDRWPLSLLDGWPDGWQNRLPEIWFDGKNYLIGEQMNHQILMRHGWWQDELPVGKQTDNQIDIQMDDPMDEQIPDEWPEYGWPCVWPNVWLAEWPRTVLWLVSSAGGVAGYIWCSGVIVGQSYIMIIVDICREGLARQGIGCMLL